jgi:CRISPR/Cas system-associated exonuclease Cas4 (RecB family)
MSKIVDDLLDSGATIRMTLKEVVAELTPEERDTLARLVDKLHEINREDAHPCPPECNRNNPCPRCRLSEQIINPLWFALWF